MRIKETGYGLPTLSNFYRENRTRSEEPESTKSAAGLSFTDALHRTEKTPAPSRTDRVEISGRAEEDESSPVKIGEELWRDISGDTDSSRLESLKSQVSSGEYSVDPSELASVLLTGI